MVTQKPRYAFDPLDVVEWTMQVQGKCTELRSKLKESQYHPTTKRGAVGPFSRQARMRMLRLVAKINWHLCNPSLFITLTYPDSVIPTSYKERSKQRYLFHRYVEKFVGTQVSSVWRIEWKVRRSGLFKGYLVPHIHLVILGIQYIPAKLVRKWWRAILGVEGPLCTDVRAIIGTDGAARYICKYLAKPSSLDYCTYRNIHWTHGREWGVHRTRLIPRHPLRLYRALTGSEVDFIRGLAGYLDAEGRAEWLGGFTVFGSDVADQVVAIFGDGLDSGVSGA